MSNNGFVSLHNHSHFSLLDGLASPEEYIARVVELGMVGFGLTDHGYLGGIPHLLSAADKQSVDLSVVPGIEAYMAPENPLGARVKEPVYYGSFDQKDCDVSSNGAYLHLTIWAYSQEGLTNLYRLSEFSFRDENFYRKPRIDFDMLSACSGGLMVSTGCPSSEISTRFRLGQDSKAFEYCGRLVDVFGSENVFIELMNHNMSSSLEVDLLSKQMLLASKFPNLMLIATNDCHYANRDDSYHHEELLCTQSKAKMTDLTYEQGGRRFAFDGNEYYLKDYNEMISLFPEHKFPGAVSNTVLVAERAKGLKPVFDSGFRPVANLSNTGFSDSITYFQTLIRKGLAKRYPDLFSYNEVNNRLLYKNGKGEAIRRVMGRINHEYEIILSSDFVDYFIIIAEAIDWVNDKYSVRDKAGNVLAHATGPGRGSAAGSLISYVLGITRVDPLKYDLLFERFLTSGRGAVLEVTLKDGSKRVINVADKVATTKGEVYGHRLQKGDVLLDE